MVKRISIVLFSIMLLIWLSPTFGGAASRERVKATGILTSVESDGAVIIDEKGYSLDKPARILDPKGRTTSLDKFQLPAKVLFEFVYTEQGPLIQVIKEIGL